MRFETRSCFHCGAVVSVAAFGEPILCGVCGPLLTIDRQTSGTPEAAETAGDATNAREPGRDSPEASGPGDAARAVPTSGR